MTPFALLVPVSGMAAAALLFDERPSGAEYVGALVVMLGLALNVIGGRFAAARRQRAA